MKGFQVRRLDPVTRQKNTLLMTAALLAAQSHSSGFIRTPLNTKKEPFTRKHLERLDQASNFGLPTELRARRKNRRKELKRISKPVKPKLSAEQRALVKAYAQAEYAGIKKSKQEILNFRNFVLKQKSLDRMLLNLAGKNYLVSDWIKVLISDEAPDQNLQEALSEATHLSQSPYHKGNLYEGRFTLALESLLANNEIDDYIVHSPGSFADKIGLDCFIKVNLASKDNPVYKYIPIQIKSSKSQVRHYYSDMKELDRFFMMDSMGLINPSTERVFYKNQKVLAINVADDSITDIINRIREIASKAKESLPKGREFQLKIQSRPLGIRLLDQKVYDSIVGTQEANRLLAKIYTNLPIDEMERVSEEVAA